MKNIKIQLVSRPIGMPAHENFALAERDMPELQEGEILVENQITIRGLLVTDYYHLWEEFYHEVGPWIRDGRVSYRETVYEGIDKAVDAFLGLFTGANIGKMIVKI